MKKRSYQTAMVPYIRPADRRRVNAHPYAQVVNVPRYYPSQATSNRPRAGYGSVTRPRGAAVTGEMKYFDATASLVALAAVTTTWVAGAMVDPETTIALGDAAVSTPLCLFAPKPTASLNGRIGRKVKILKVKVNGMINIADQSAIASAPHSTRFRLLLVLDKQTNAAQMTAASLMNDGTDANSTFFSYQNPNNFGRFQVLKEKRFVMDNASITGDAAGSVIEASGQTRHWKMNYNFKFPLAVNFNAVVGGTVADIIDNSLHIVCIADNITNGAPTISYYSRVCYKE